MRKNIIFLLLAVGSLLLAGCQKFGALAPGNKSAVRFTAVSSAAGTKTAYSGVETTEGTRKYERIDWVNGDAIRIWSDVATVGNTASHWSDYTVTGAGADPNNPRYSNASLANRSDNGLTWGAAGNYKFHAVYPARTISADGATTACHIPDEQAPAFGTTRVGAPDMSNAFMTASTTATTATAGEGVPVRLLFDPAFTAFEVSLASESQTLYLDSFSIQSDGGSPVAGDFTVTFEGTGDSKYAPSTTAGTTQSRISVDLNDMVLTPTNGLTFTVFALPEAYDDLSITFNVKTDLTAATPTSRTLKLQRSGSYVEFAQCAKHRIYGLALNAETWEVITVTGEDVLWDTEGLGEDVYWDAD